MKRFKVVIADDTKGILDYLAHILNGSDDFEVVGTAQDGKILLNLVQDLRPDLVVTDVDMPYVTGIEAIQKLREIPDIKYVIITGNSTAELVRQASELDVKEIIKKPIDSEKYFLDTLTNVMNTEEYQKPIEKNAKRKKGILKRILGR